MGLYTEVSGDGADAIVLLHGMGATGAVWRRTVAELAGGWHGSIVVCDLPGHGRSTPLASYTYDAVAAAVAATVPHCRSLFLVGHSFGGYVAMVLASGRFGVVPAGIVAASVKVNWTPDELSGVAAVAAKPVRLFDTIDEAQERYRKVAGLTSDITDAPEDLARGVSPSGPHYRLSQDPAAGTVGEPDVSGALAAARCPVWLLRGVADRMVSDAELSALAVPVVTIPDAGHNVHVEQPRLFARAVLDVVVGGV